MYNGLVKHLLPRRLLSVSSSSFFPEFRSYLNTSTFPSKGQYRRIISFPSSPSLLFLPSHLSHPFSSMSSSPPTLSSLEAEVKLHADAVKKLKDSKAPKAEIEAAVAKLKSAKEELSKLSSSASSSSSIESKDPFNTKQYNRAAVEDLLIRRFFYVNSFEIYGGVGGLYDYGPSGCAVKQNLISFWRQHFVMTESMLEVDCSVMTPEPVLAASGHVAKFSDFIVRDEKTNDGFRADKVLEDAIDKLLDDKKNPPSSSLLKELQSDRSAAGAMKAPQLDECIKKYNVKSPDTGNPLSYPEPYNLMFKTSIGPTGKQVGFLRPETAQGIFVNFRRLLDANLGKLPFAAAQIGLAFRNEIAPRAGLLRVREFTMAEIEHFVNPKDKKHPKFKEVSHVVMNILGRADQVGEEKSRRITIGEAVAEGTVTNETLGYFMARTQLFLIAIGVQEDKIRFRQHKEDEMAHYAECCFDAEIHGSYGWTECVGIADRSAYDLTAHTKSSKVDLIAIETLREPIFEDKCTFKMNFPLITSTFKENPNSKTVIESIRNLEKDHVAAVKFSEELKTNGSALLKIDNQDVKIDGAMLEFKSEKVKITSRRITPGVVEPSFGIGRILYHLFEHAFYQRPGAEKRGVLRLSPIVAPIKVAVLSLSEDEKFSPFLSELNRAFTFANISSKIDHTSASVGKRYSRADEIGSPFALTVDFETADPSHAKFRTVTIRERDSMKQIRVKIEEVVSILQPLLQLQTKWEDLYNSGKYEQIIRKEEDEK